MIPKNGAELMRYVLVDSCLYHRKLELCNRIQDLREGENMSHEVKKQYLNQIKGRYKNSTKKQKQLILTEFCIVCLYSRKHAIRLLNGQCQPRSHRTGPRAKYPKELIKPLKTLWFAMGQVCSKRMKAALPAWLPHYRRRHPELSDEHAVLLLQISPATIDRLLKPIRAKRGLSTTTAPTGQWYKNVIPIKPHDWDVTKPGHLQGDTVAHCGDTTEGTYVNTLTLTDIHTSWTENRATWGKGSGGIIEAVKDVERALPFQISSIKFDSGTEFMNHGLISHLRSTAIRAKAIDLFRSRPYRKNDNCYVEEKNLTHVRQLLGYERFDRSALVPLLNEIYTQYWNPLQNFFLPAIKLERKTRIGSQIKKEYDKPRTPYQRLLESADVVEESKAKLKEHYASLDPFSLTEALELKLKEFFQALRREKLKIAA